jgi:heterodisulfide reductase subunit B
MCKTLDIKMTEIPDWNCCGASVSYAEAGELPRHVMNARNFALAESNCLARISSPPAPPAGWVRVSPRNVWNTTPA